MKAPLTKKSPFHFSVLQSCYSFQICCCFIFMLLRHFAAIRLCPVSHDIIMFLFFCYNLFSSEIIRFCKVVCFVHAQCILALLILSSKFYIRFVIYCTILLVHVQYKISGCRTTNSSQFTILNIRSIQNKSKTFK
jgi:hypothetical protein